MRKHIPHPISLYRSPFASLHVLYGGTADTMLEETIAVCRDLCPAMEKGEEILYVNTLCTERELFARIGKRFSYGPYYNKVISVTYCTGQIMRKLAMIERLCRERYIKHLLLNGFELVAFTERHRAR